MQDELPIVRLHRCTAAEVTRAHAAAVKLFDRDGKNGVRRRHRFALENHMFASRIRAIVKASRSLAH